MTRGLRVLAFALASAVIACGGESGNDKDEDDGGGSGGGGFGGKPGNVVVKKLDQSGVDKADLLFMVDNSISMADKQALLAEAIPVLVSRLVDPLCVDVDGNPTGGTTSSGCGTGTAEFPPIKNIHVGIITSSLGNHGGDVCVPDPNDTVVRTLNDQAQLLPTMRPSANPPLYSWNNSGFLVWDPGTDRPIPDPHQPLSMHETDAATFVADFQSHVRMAGERGCGYEASLEAWYRFLIDPEPIATVTNDGTFSVRGQVNQVVLDQRRAFLRPDSLLAIVMLTDENDCSIVDENEQQGWLVGRRIQMPRASSECAQPGTQAFEKCCRACVVEKPGCPASAGDPECQKGGSLTPAEDATNLRCYNQEKRFGFSLLYPTERYSDGLTLPTLVTRTGETVPNPIYTPGIDGTPARTPALVYLAGIVGVPWQDIADDVSRMAGVRGLRYLTAAELDAFGRWDVILGDPDENRPPSDPFMIETPDVRNGTNPVTADAIMPPALTSTGNAINGHEQNVVGRDDLQYACTFDLVPDVECGMANQDGCDCNASEAANQRSLCEYPAGANAEGTQVRGKAYPATRELQVLKAFGENAIVASICPKNVQAMGANDVAYGYNPAMSAMADRFKEAFQPSCLPRPIAMDREGRIPCTVVEASYVVNRECDCYRPGLTALATANIETAIHDELMAAGQCGGGTNVSCSDYCLCEVMQLQGDDLYACQSSPTAPSGPTGFCYVPAEYGASTLLAQCPATQQQFIRFVGDDLPRKGAEVFLACTGG